MYEQVDKPKENKSRAVADSATQKKDNGKKGFGFVDNRPDSITQRKMETLINGFLSQSIPKKIQKTSHNLIQRVEKKRRMQVYGGVEEIHWEKVDLDFDSLKPSDARKILKNIKLEEMRAPQEEVIRLQKILVLAPDINPLTEEDAEWVKEIGLIHRFHTSGSTLKKEYDKKFLSGHQTALYDIKNSDTETLKNLFMSLIKVGTTSLSHVERTGADAGHVLSSSKPSEQKEKLMTWANAPSYLADTSQQPVGEIAHFVQQTVKINGFEDYHDALISMLDVIITFIKTRGKSIKPTETISEIRLPIFDDELLQGLKEMEKKLNPQQTLLAEKKDTEGSVGESSQYIQKIGVFGQLSSKDWCRTDDQDPKKRFTVEGDLENPLFINVMDKFDEYEKDGSESLR